MSPRPLTITAMVFIVSAMVASGITRGDPPPADPALDLFKQRILPIFQSPKPSSCVQCHLASVDLKDYILPSHEQTFASLRQQGLIDLDAPEKSKILTLITMGQQDLDEGAKLIHKPMRDAEYEAFAAWIKACAADPRLRSLPAPTADELARPDKPNEVIRHARKDRVIDSFVRNVWSQRMRCFPCHTPYELDKADPAHQKPDERYREYLRDFGPRMNLFRKTPEATFEYLTSPKNRKASDQRLPLINTADPSQSLLVLKPTAKLPGKDENGVLRDPSFVAPVSHGGGLKMFVDDPSYKAFTAWIADYAKVVDEKYASPDALPADNWVPTKQMLRMKDLPDSFPAAAIVQLHLYAWDDDAKAWATTPIAFTQGLVTPKRLVNGTLFLLEPERESPASPRRWKSVGDMLPGGRFLVKVYLDAGKKLAKDPTLMLGQDELAGQCELSAETWEEGFPKAQWISGKDLASGEVK